MKGRESVGWVGSSVTDVRGASSSVEHQYHLFPGVNSICRWHTFEADRGVWIIFGSDGDGVLYSLFVIVAIDVVAVLVYQWRVSTYDGPSITSMLDFLRT